MAITKYRSQLFATSEHVALHIRQAQNALATLGRNIAEMLQEAVRARENDLRKLLASSLVAIVVTDRKIAKFRSQLFVALEQARVSLQRTQNTLLRLARSTAEKRWRLQEAVRARENDLRKLLAGSLDAIVVTNGDRRFVAANPKALDLFGISEANMREFTIDAFVPYGQILDFDGTGPPFIRQKERSGNCNIRRLDGGLRVAEYIFVANFVPRRHLCRFLKIKTVRSNLIAPFKSRPLLKDSNSSQLH
jgi:PAS domain S-box-containing protein